MSLRTVPTLLLAAATLAVAAPAATVGERIAAVTIDGGAAVYSGGADGLPARRALRGADRAVLSPDGTVVAYARLVRGRTELRVARVAGAAADRLLVRLPRHDVSLAFSPDGARLAYTSAEGIATIAVGGGDRRRVRVPAAWRGSRYAHLAFTPDGRRLLLSRSTGDGREGTLRNELAAVELATGRAATLLRSPNPYDEQARPASFTPDGAFVAVDGVRGVRLVPTAPGEGRQLTTTARNVYDRTPVVSPDGGLVAFARHPYGGVSDVWVVGVDGTGLRRLTTTPVPPRGVGRVGSSPLAWSPDGTRLLVFRHDRFAVVDVETGTSTDLRQVGLRYSIASARWTGAPAAP